jgi:hypothetical protein
MNNNKIVLSSLALDLRRVAIGYYRGSSKMAERFLQEALKRKQEIDVVTIKPYLQKLLSKVDNISDEEDDKQKAEDALMYSILFQNAALAS